MPMDAPRPPVPPDDEPEELPRGIDYELFLGTPGESPEERAARLDAARDILAELHAQGTDDEVTAVDALLAEQLLRTVPLWRRASRRRWTGGRDAGDAA